MATIAVDFDGCLHGGKWPGIGQPNIEAIEELITRQEAGDKVILWTCRDGEQLEEAVRWCAEQGLIFDAVNDNLPEHKAQYNNNTRKVYAHEYWDDRAVKVIAEEG